MPGFSGSPEPSSDPKDQKLEPGDAIGAARLEQIASECEVWRELPWARSRARVRECACVCKEEGNARGPARPRGGFTQGQETCVSLCVCVCVLELGL